MSSHPDSHGPLCNCSYHPFIKTNCFSINAIGYAILGLDGDFDTLMKKYREQIRRAKLGKEIGTMQLYTAVADMLGLPVKLLWDTDFQSYMGMFVDGVIDELRKPQRGYC